VLNHKVEVGSTVDGGSHFSIEALRANAAAGECAMLAGGSADPINSYLENSR